MRLEEELARRSAPIMRKWLDEVLKKPLTYWVYRGPCK